MVKKRRPSKKTPAVKAVARRAGMVPRTLLTDVRSLIDAARQHVASTINSELTWLYWQIGNRIRKDVLADERAEYGKQIVYALSRQLTGEYGAGFTSANLFHMLRFIEAFPDEKIVHALRDT